MAIGGGPPPLETTLKPRPVSLSATVKFLCSYDGRIVPRHTDASLRYVGGVTRLLSVPRSLSFPELLVKMGELCGVTVFLRCQWPMEDLDALVSITCDDDLANLIEEYDRAAIPKIRAFLSLPKLAKPTSPPSSLASSSSSRSSSSSSGATVNSLSSPLFAKPAAADRCLPQFMARRPRKSSMSPSLCSEKAVGKMLNHHPLVYGNYGHGNLGHVYLVHLGNHRLGLVSESSKVFSAQEIEWFGSALPQIGSFCPRITRSAAATTTWRLTVHTLSRSQTTRMSILGFVRWINYSANGQKDRSIGGEEWAL